MAQKEQWGTRLGVILAVAGSAVGLGNFLRFPGQAAANGGGSFMLPYFIALLLVGLPIAWAEWIMGRAGGRLGYNSCPAIFGILGRHRIWRYGGVFGLLIPIAVYMYYVLIESWCLGYALMYATGSIDLGSDPNQYAEASKKVYHDFVGYEANGLTGGVVWFALITFALNFFLIYRGLSKGIEWFCTRAMPIMVICAFIVLIRVMTFGTPNPDKPELNVSTGLGFMWNPQAKEITPLDADGNSLLDDDRNPIDETALDRTASLRMEPVGTWYSGLFNSKTWLAAVGQIFFSLSVGFGIIVNYASYLKRKDDVVLSGLTAASTNEFFEVCLGGLITIPAAYMFLGASGIFKPDGTAIGTFDLGFQTLPVVFRSMGSWERIVGVSWFGMLFFAAITSSLSMLQPAIAFLEEALGIGRKASVAILGMVTAMGSLFVVYFSEGLKALNTVDFWVGTALIYVLAMIEVILFSWVYGVEKGFKEAQDGAQLRLPVAWKFVIKWVSPIFLITIFVSWCFQYLPGEITKLREDRVIFYSIMMIFVLAIFLVIMIHLAAARWDERDKAILAGETEAS